MIQKLERYHRWTLYLTLAIAFAAVAMGNTMSIILGVAYPVVFIGSWIAEDRGWTDDLPQWLGNALILTAFSAEILQIVIRNEGYIAAGIRFVLILTAIKLWTRTSARDDLQLYALSFMTIAVATTDNTGVTFGITFAAYILAGTFSLALYHLLEEHRDRPGTALSNAFPFDRQYAIALTTLSIFVFATSLVIFFGFPRIGLGFFAQGSRSGLNVGGFSENVELGQHGTIRDNPDIAMRVQFPDGRPSGNLDTIHWRTIAFDHYDGSGWSRTDRERARPLHPDDGVYDFGDQYLFRMASPETGAERFRIYLEPLSTDLLPIPWPARSIEFANSYDESIPGSPRSGRIEVTPYGEPKHTVGSDIGLAYTVRRARTPDPDSLRTIDGDYPRGNFRERYLQLPDLTDRVEDLADSITADADTPYAKAEAIESYLRTTYTYTNDLPAIDGSDPVDAFLFETQRGHCEYFSTAMVLLLRHSGVPARNVNGFLGGNWNGVGDYLAVRQGDAHSWVEVYIPTFGWIQMDPTPAGSREPIYGAYGRFFRDTYDSLRMQWMQWVIEYDLNRQIRIASRFLEALEPNMEGDQNNESSSDDDNTDSGLAFRHWFGGFGLLLMSAFAARIRTNRRWWWTTARLTFTTGLAVGWSIWFWGTNVGAISAGLGLPLLAAAASAAWSRLAHRPETFASRQFVRIESAASNTPLARDAGEPPETFLRRLHDELPAARSALNYFRTRYLAARFGRQTIDRDKLERAADQVVDAIRRA